MARTEVRGSNQIKDLTLTRAKLKADFLEGSDLNFTNGANDATITGLKDGANANDAVNKSQLDALASSVASGLKYRGGLASGSDLSGNATGNTYLDGSNGLITGDFFFVTSSGTVTDGTNNLTVNTGDMIIANKDVAADASINVSTDFDLIDNTEAADILRTGDVVDNLASTATDAPLSANQGKVLGDRVTAIEAFGIPVYGEIPTVTGGSSVIGALANTPLTGTEEVYLNGLRQESGAGNDYTINYVSGVITFEFAMQSTDKVLVDYKR